MRVPQPKGLPRTRPKRLAGDKGYAYAKTRRCLRRHKIVSVIHVYNEKSDVLHAGGSVIWLHTETGGTCSISLRNGKSVEISLKPWSTVILDADTGTPLLND